jgi:hypothetical protein
MLRYLNAYVEKNDHIKNKELNILHGLLGRIDDYVKNLEFHVQFIEHFADIQGR